MCQIEFKKTPNILYSLEVFNIQLYLCYQILYNNQYYISISDVTNIVANLT